MEYTKIGYIQKPHSITGELKISIEEKFIDILFEMDVLFVEIRGQKIPHFIKDLREGNALILQLEDIKDRNSAELLGKKDLYLRREDIDLTDEEIALPDGIEYAYLVGFALLDSELGEMGIITEVVEYPQQEIAYVQHKEREVLVPLRKEWILNEDKVSKKITMELPEGLFEL